MIEEIIHFLNCIQKISTVYIIKYNKINFYMYIEYSDKSSSDISISEGLVDEEKIIQ